PLTALLLPEWRDFERWRAPRFVLQRVLDKEPELARARRMAEFSQHDRFDLADALASNGEGPADLLESAFAVVVQAKPHPNNCFLARRERLQHQCHAFLEVKVDGRVRRRCRSLI